jgi:hypothetical protein
MTNRTIGRGAPIEAGLPASNNPEGSCTRVELVNKADAYDAAIWDSNNR